MSYIGTDVDDRAESHLTQRGVTNLLRKGGRVESVLTRVASGALSIRAARLEILGLTRAVRRRATKSATRTEVA